MLLLILWWIWYYSYNKYALLEKNTLIANSGAKSNFTAVKKYLVKNFNWKYPIPSWDIILLDNTNQLIHLEDRNTPLNKIKNLSVIQWTTCDILKNDKKFDKINYDSRFTIKDKNTKKILFKRCFSYSVTKDRKYFQIWTIENKNWKYVSKIEWNSKKNMIKSYDSDVLVKNNSDIFLPYSPNSLSPILKVANLWDSQLKLKIYDKLNDTTKEIKVKNGNNVLLTWDVNWKYDITLKWYIKDKTNIKFISTDWSIVYIKWDKKNWKVDFSLKNYKIWWENLDYFTVTWRFIASIVKLSSDKNMTVNKNWVTLVIRWTKFTINADDDNFDTFLSLWHIVQKLWNQNIDITLQNAFSLLENNKIVQDLKKIKQLAWFTVYSDVVNMPKYTYDVNNNSWFSDILSGISSIKRYSINYKNWQKIWIVKMKLTKSIKDILKMNKSKFNLNWYKFEWKWSDMVYSNIVNTICKSQKYNAWLDISKIHYLLKTSNGLLKFNLISDIKEKLWNMWNYVVLTSRKYDKRENSSRLWFNSITNSIDTIWLHSLKLRWYDTVLFACDEN